MAKRETKKQPIWPYEKVGKRIEEEEIRYLTAKTTNIRNASGHKVMELGRNRQTKTSLQTLRNRYYYLKSIRADKIERAVYISEYERWKSQITKMIEEKDYNNNKYNKDRFNGYEKLKDIMSTLNDNEKVEFIKEGLNLELSVFYDNLIRDLESDESEAVWWLVERFELLRNDMEQFREWEEEDQRYYEKEKKKEERKRK